MMEGERREFRAKWSALAYWGARLHWALAVSEVLGLAATSGALALLVLSEGYASYAPPWYYLTWKSYLGVIVLIAAAYLLVSESIKLASQAQQYAAGPEVILDGQQIFVRKDNGWCLSLPWDELIAVSVFEADPKPARKVVWLRLHCNGGYVRVPRRVEEQEELLDELVRRRGLAKTRTHGVVDWYSALRPEEAHKLRTRWRPLKWLPPAGEVELPYLRRLSRRRWLRLVALAAALAVLWLGLGWAPMAAPEQAETQLVAFGQDYLVRLAPRPGSLQVAIEAYRSASKKERLLIVSPDGTVRHLTDWVEYVGCPAWSPDGQWLAYTRGRYRLTSEEETELAPYRRFAGPKREPTERESALLDKSSTWELCLLRVDTGELRVLKEVTGKARVWSLAWSPSGKRLALVATVEQGQEMGLELTTIALAEGRQTGRSLPLPADTMLGLDWEMAWSPDGSKLALNLTSHAHAGRFGLIYPSRLGVVDLHSGKWRFLAPDTYFSMGVGALPVWSADSKWVTYVSIKLGAFVAERFSVETGERQRLWRQVVPRPYAPGPEGYWLGQGPVLAVTSESYDRRSAPEEQSVLLLVGPEGTRVVQLSQEYAFKFVCSDDGTQAVLRIYKQGLLFVKAPEGVR